MATALAHLLATPEPPELGPGPRAGVEPEAILNAKLDKLFQEQRLVPENQKIMRAVILLWHDHLTAGHAIAQSMETPDGALVHGIMHRREPDYANAAYWFRRARGHPVFPALAEAVSGCLAGSDESLLCEQVVPRGQWDPFAFVAACEQSAHLPASHLRVKTLREIQRLESKILLDFLIRSGTES